ncbi:MAG TPA: hypothetical protein VME40_11795 [Caulobacteraceae bacterium]|nr:hypothetical protein [Caulobacteraceae bacterium]
MPLNRRQLSLRLLVLPAVAADPSTLLAQARFNGGPPPNLFISPCGQPFRAKRGAAYPVVDWFHQADKNGDGKIDRAEFNADAEASFHTLDQNHDGVLSPYEVNYYELRICPEVVGARVESWQDRRDPGAARLWLAQFGGGGGGGQGRAGGGNIAPGGPPPTSSGPAPNPADESNKGASPYSFFDEPEPVAAADVRFVGLISKADFLTLSNAHFDALDKDGPGYLTLDALPKTPVQRHLAREGGRRRPDGYPQSE